MKPDPTSEFLLNEHLRTSRFEHNEKLDALLAELRGLLEPVQEKVNTRFDVPKNPIALIIGLPRSGSTLLLQWLAGTGHFAYPSNLLARFAYAPFIGAQIQKLLFDPEFDYQGEFKDLQGEVSFSSDLGKSKGGLATNEFFYFWRNYFPNHDPDWLCDDQLKRVEVKKCFQAIASIEAAYNKPFVAKGWMFQYNLDALYPQMPTTVFLCLQRDPKFVMQSILWSREQYYNRRDLWFSVKPKEYQQLRDMDVYHQIAGQVYFTEKAISEGLGNIDVANKLTLEYESFCKNPKTAYEQVVQKYEAVGCSLPLEYIGPESFICGNEIRLPKADIDGLEQAYDEFVSDKVV